MKQDINRRDLFKLGVAGAAVLAAGGAIGTPALAGTVNLAKGGKDYSPATGDERPGSKRRPWFAKFTFGTQ